MYVALPWAPEKTDRRVGFLPRLKPGSSSLLLFDTKMYECDYCDATFKAVSNLGGHVAPTYRCGEYECEMRVDIFPALMREAFFSILRIPTQHPFTYI